MTKAKYWFAATLLSVAAASSHAQETLLDAFKPGSWLCASPKVYDEAMVRVAEFGGKELETLKKELSEQQKCMYIDEEMVESMQAPFALIIKREGTKVQVQFVVVNRQRIELLHRRTNKMVFQGWTDESNLVKKKVL
jgi:hypothetical protein